MVDSQERGRRQGGKKERAEELFVSGGWCSCKEKRVEV